MMSSKVIAFSLLLIMTSIKSSFSLYDEPFRQQFHYSPLKGWMNDPNGLVFYNNTFHLFFQFNPVADANVLKNWGHAVSKDLFHWQTLPVGINADAKTGGNIFSGSAIIDTDNVSGFQTNTTGANKTMIAFYTRHKDPERLENQWISYSTDEGLTFKFYDKNPVIPNPKIADFRDPKVFRYNNSHFVVILSAGTHVQLYKSSNLRDWTYLSDFGLKDGSHNGVWECPDLFPLDVVIKGKQVQKWVLTVGVESKAQYFIGSFDGQKFINDNSPQTIRWVDYGPESYAGVTYNMAPNNRRIFISWMMAWDYAMKVPTNGWIGSMSVPRDLNLVVGNDDSVRLASQPAPDIKNLKTKSYELKDRTLKANTSLNINDLYKTQSKLLDIELSVELKSSDSTGSFGLIFAGNKDQLKVYFKQKENQFTIDRSNTGKHDFRDKFTLTPSAPRLTSNPVIDLRLVLDVASIELFADRGLTVMSAVFYTTDDLNSKMSLFYETNDKNSELKVISISINELKSVWK